MAKGEESFPIVFSDVLPEERTLVPKAPPKGAQALLAANHVRVKASAALKKLKTEDAIQQWSKGALTLKELKGYDDDSLYNIAHQGYILYLNGQIEDAQTIFEGLVAVDPRNEYHFRALGVIYHRLGDAERALKQFTHAITVAPSVPTAYVNRAEVHIARRDFGRALQDLVRVQEIGHPDHPVVRKARALRSLLTRNNTIVPRS